MGKMRGLFTGSWGIARILFLIFLFSFVLLSGCSSSKSSEQSSANYDSAASEEPMDLEVTEMPAVESELAENKLDSSTVSTSYELAAETPQEGGIAAATGPQSFNQKLIYTANLSMEVKDYAKAQTEIRNMIHLSDAYILQFSDQKSLHEEGGTFTIKVPAGDFFSFLSELEKMKPVSLQRSVKGQDVTEEYVDLTARLKAKQVVEARLLAFMEKASKADDLVKFSNELGRIQEEIEQIKGRMRYLDQNVAYSTVEIRLYERLEAVAANIKAEKQDPVYDRAWKAMKGSSAFIYRALQGILVIAAGALPILILVGFLVIPLVYVIRRRKKAADRNL